jgi:type IV secretion system protein VirD4
MQESPLLDGLIAGMGHQLTWYADKELASIQSTITRFTSWLDSPAMKAITSTSTFDPRKLGTCKATVYLVLPARRMKTLAPLNRMWISTIMGALISGAADERKRVLFILDEAGHLGPMQILEDAVTLMRGYGIRLMFIFQNIGQVSEVFGDRAPRFLDNIATQIYFGVNAYESAEAISKRCGDSTVLVQSLNDSNSFSRPTGGFSKDNRGNVSKSRSINYAEVGRPLFRPDEVLRLHEDVALLFHRNMPVMPIKLLRHYKEWEFKWGGTAPYRGGVGLRAGLLAVMALLASLVLLAVSMYLPAFIAEQQRFQQATWPDDMPPEPQSVDSGTVVEEVIPSDPPAVWGPVMPLPGRSLRRLYTPTPYPDGTGIQPRQRQRAARGLNR